MRFRTGFALLAAAFVAGAGPAAAGEDDGSGGGGGGLGDVRDLSFVAMPFPVSNPAVGDGVAAVALGLYRVGDSKRPWTTGAGGFYTNSKSWAAAAFQKAYLDGERHRLTGAIVAGDLKIDYFGIGQVANRRGRSIPIEIETKGGLAEALVGVAHNLHIGPHYRLIDTRTTYDLSQTPFADLAIGDAELVSKTALLGLSGEYDTRDSEYSPRRGWYVTGRALRADPAFGGDFTYTRAEMAANRYMSVGSQGVLAMRASLCWSGADAPFYDLCAFGSQSDLRGYVAGEYLDHAMYAVQAEYRRHLFWRIGGAVFAGVGATGRNFGSMSTADMLPAAGLGLRLEASKRYGVNARIDYAWGRDGSEAIYFSVGEAF